ncbi:MAG: toprim domain-containing protein, partial [Bacteroidales bacterium]|nr:toprim domain-containing protein [Bacteroidales bacterium]
TALTVEQIRLVRKFTENMTIMYDGDSAGIKAAIRGLDLVLSEGMNVRIVLLPEGDDPDSFCRSHSTPEVERYIEENASDFITFKTELLLSEAGNDPLRKANLINDIADSIALIPDAVKRSVYVDSVALKFGLEREIIFQRISRRLREMEEKPLYSQQRDSQPQPSPMPASEPVPQTAAPLPYPLENPTLANAESDLLFFLVNHGCDVLEFESDSEFYSGDETSKPTVADFIRDSLEADGCELANTAYKLLYDRFMALYDEGLDQDAIVRDILDGEDRVSAAICAGLSTEKYPLTVKDFENALTTTGSWLVRFVPRALLCYAERRVHDNIEKLKRSLEAASEQEQEEMLRSIVKLQGAQLRIKKKLGREK